MIMKAAQVTQELNEQAKEMRKAVNGAEASHEQTGVKGAEIMGHRGGVIVYH